MQWGHAPGAAQSFPSWTAYLGHTVPEQFPTALRRPQSDANSETQGAEEQE